MESLPGTPAVAVIIPAYNAAGTIAATLDSLLSQSFRDFEAVVVDDGSSDETFEIASAFAAKDARLKAIRQPNSGVADARNVAIAHTRAPLIAALDADDVWHPTFLERLSSALQSGGADTVLAYANSRIIDLTGRVLDNAPSAQHAGRAFNRLLLHNFIGNGSAMMFRRDLALAVGAYDRRLQHELAAQGSEDWLLTMRLAANGKIAAVHEYLVGYRAVSGAMSENTLRMRRSRLYALEILLSEVKCRNRTAARWALGTAHAKCFLHEVLALRFGAALSSLLTALRLDPAGTCYLLFGSERLEWLKRRCFQPATYPRAGHLFVDFDPREGQWDHVASRVAKARRWDADEGLVAD